MMDPYSSDNVDYPEISHTAATYPGGHLPPSPHFQHQYLGYPNSASTSAPQLLSSGLPSTSEISLPLYNPVSHHETRNVYGFPQQPMSSDYPNASFQSPSYVDSRRGSLAHSESVSTGQVSEGEMAASGDHSFRRTYSGGKEPVPAGSKPLTAPPVKLHSQRSGSACTNCRKSKMKCDGRAPCARCVNSGHSVDACRYEPPPPSTTPRQRKGTISQAAIDARAAAFEARLTRLEQGQQSATSSLHPSHDKLEQRIQDLEQQVAMLIEAVQNRSAPIDDFHYANRENDQVNGNAEHGTRRNVDSLGNAR